MPVDFPSLLTDDDLHFFNEGTHTRLYDKLGAHPGVVDGAWGTYFAVWAPNAVSVSVIGEWNAWSADSAPMRPRASSGIWEAFVPGVGRGALYKYRIRGAEGHEGDKADPFGFMHECPPKTASVVSAPEYRWNDASWMQTRGERQSLSAPMSVYELHLGSWMRVPEEGDRSLTYREIAPRLAEHVLKMGFTHVELLPVMEHPFGGSWGYQVTGYFAPTRRFGEPADFMYFVDYLHQKGIGVILDWVPAHFPSDAHGLAFFDGTHLFEHADPRKGFHPDWKSLIFNYGRHEVKSFLISSATFWLDRYHLDGLRVDGVASMLYLDYSRKDGEWIPNEHGGRENLEAISLLRQMNETVYREFPGVQTIAEESTAWPMVSRPTSMGGLGFGLKWDLGWMHDSLSYLERDPIHRRWHHSAITFRALYAFHENFVLPLSHDEVVHGKGSLLNKMPGDRWQKFANLRLLFAWQFAQPGKKLVFMGGEFGQWREWDHDGSLDWHLCEEREHGGLMRMVADCNRLYRDESALHALDCDPAGYRWIDGSDAEQSAIAFVREDGQGSAIIAIFNFTPVVRYGYGIGAPRAGAWEEIFNSDSEAYGGSGVGNLGVVTATEEPLHSLPCRLLVTLPPLGCVLLRGPALAAG